MSLLEINFICFSQYVCCRNKPLEIVESKWKYLCQENCLSVGIWYHDNLCLSHYGYTYLCSGSAINIIMMKSVSMFSKLDRVKTFMSIDNR